MKPIICLMGALAWMVLALCPIFANAADPISLSQIASSDRQWTGVAVSQTGRIFVNFPRWSEDIPFSVGELTAYGKVIPFPDANWNQWDGQTSPQDHFICVQSVFVDDDNYLWVLDPANPMFSGVVEGGPKIVKFDIETKERVQQIRFDKRVVLSDSYLNDIRVDTKQKVAYLTDSGNGALIVVDLKTQKARRVLDDHPSTQAKNVTLIVERTPWTQPDGTVPQIHADGIALSPDRHYLYYKALSGRGLYRIQTRWLQDKEMSAEALGEKVEHLGQVGASDGMVFDKAGNLYLSALEYNAIRRYTPTGDLETVVRDPRLKWPDSFARGPDGGIVVTSSQIHLGAKVSQPYRIFKYYPN